MGSYRSQATGDPVRPDGAAESKLNYVNQISHEKAEPGFRLCCVCILALGTHLSEALAAVHGTIGLGLEGNLCLTAATCAGGSEELTGATGAVLAGVTAGLAALGLILEATLSVESLFTGGENEFVAALFAN